MILKDPNGKAAEAVVSEDGKTITVKATIRFYGGEASPDKAARIAAAIQRLWNEGSKNGVVINGKKYEVKFEIKGEAISETAAKEQIARNKKDEDPQLNFIRLEIYNNMNMSYVDPSGNTGYWRGMPMFGNHMETSPAHEFGHLMGYDTGVETATRKSTHDEWKGEQHPSIMANWDGGLKGYGVPDALLGNLRVRPETIARIFDGKDLTPGNSIRLGRQTNKYHKKGY